MASRLDGVAPSLQRARDERAVARSAIVVRGDDRSGVQNVAPQIQERVRPRRRRVQPYLNRRRLGQQEFVVGGLAVGFGCGIAVRGPRDAGARQRRSGQRAEIGRPAIQAIGGVGNGERERAERLRGVRGHLEGESAAADKPLHARIRIQREFADVVALRVGIAPLAPAGAQVEGGVRVRRLQVYLDVRQRACKPECVVPRVAPRRFGGVAAVRPCPVHGRRGRRDVDSLAACGRQVGGQRKRERLVALARGGGGFHRVSPRRERAGYAGARPAAAVVVALDGVLVWVSEPMRLAPQVQNRVGVGRRRQVYRHVGGARQGESVVFPAPLVAAGVAGCRPSPRRGAGRRR